MLRIYAPGVKVIRYLGVVVPLQQLYGDGGSGMFGVGG